MIIVFYVSFALLDFFWVYTMKQNFIRDHVVTVTSPVTVCCFAVLLQKFTVNENLLKVFSVSISHHSTTGSVKLPQTKLHFSFLFLSCCNCIF